MGLITVLFFKTKDGFIHVEEYLIILILRLMMI